MIEAAPGRANMTKSTPAKFPSQSSREPEVDIGRRPATRPATRTPCGRQALGGTNPGWDAQLRARCLRVPEPEAPVQHQRAWRVAAYAARQRQSPRRISDA